MTGLTTLDHLVLFVYLALVVAIGSSFVRSQKDTEEYFLAGRRMPWVAVGISIFATLFRAISLLGSPGWVYDHNLALGLTLLTIPLVTPVVTLVFLPFYQRLKVFTAYQYLELRFSPAVRSAASALLLLQRGAYLAVVIYAPSLGLPTVTGLSLSARRRIRSQPAAAGTPSGKPAGTHPQPAAPPGRSRVSKPGVRLPTRGKTLHLLLMAFFSSTMAWAI